MAAVLSCDHRWAGLQWFGHIVGCKIHEEIVSDSKIERTLGPGKCAASCHSDSC